MQWPRPPMTCPLWDDAWIVSRRPARPEVDPWRPHGYLRRGRALAGRHDRAGGDAAARGQGVPVSLPDVRPVEVHHDHAHPRRGDPRADRAMPWPGCRQARHVKLYNAGNFFDAQAVPAGRPAAHRRADGPFRAVLVECHPRLVDWALPGLSRPPRGQARSRDGAGDDPPRGSASAEQAHDPRRLRARDAHSSANTASPCAAFVLVRPPLLDEAEGVEWAVRSVAWALERRRRVLHADPDARRQRGDGGAARAGAVRRRPSLGSLEEALDRCLALGGGRVFADLWDIAALATCPDCGPARVDRLRRMNLEQIVLPAVRCHCEAAR